MPIAFSGSDGNARMMFWLLVAVLSTAVTYWVTRPLLSGDNDPVAPVAADIAVYKDQLAEIDADLARGQLSPAEAEAARTEVSRRLLRLSSAPADLADTTSSQPKSLPMTMMHAAASLLLPTAALGLYLVYGSPNLPSLPLNDRLAAAPERATAADLIAKIEARLREAPDDGKGWEVIGPVYVAQGRFAEAVDAFSNAIRLLGETPRRLEGLAMADIRASNGLVSEKARKAFQRSLELDPARTEPRLWLALAKEQDGKIDDAVADYKALFAQAPKDAPWRKAVEERIATLSAGQDAAQQTPPAPPKAQPSVAELPSEQREIIDRMVSGLAARLKENGNDLDGWLKLMRSLKVLGRDSEATAALADAKKQFAQDGKAIEQIDGLAKSLGLGS